MIKDDYNRTDQADIASANATFGGADQGYSYTNIGAFTVELEGNRAQGPDGASNASLEMIYRADSDLGGIDHYIQADVRIAAEPTSGVNIGLFARKDGTATNEWYVGLLVYRTGANTEAYIYKRDTGGYTQLGSGVDLGSELAFGTLRTLYFEATGTSTVTLVMKHNGSTIITRTDSTSPLTSGERVGIYGFSAVGGSQQPVWDNLEADETTPSPGSGLAGPLTNSTFLKSKLGALVS